MRNSVWNQKLKYATKKIHNEVTFEQTSIEIQREIYKALHSSNQYGQYSNHSINEGGYSKGQEVIKEYLSCEEPCMLARFGATELRAFSTWMQVNNKLTDSFAFDKRKYVKDECMPNWFSIRNMYGMEYLSGFFPATQENLQRWGSIVEEDINEIDLLFTWQEMEKYICEYLNGVPRVFFADMYYPYRFTNPWCAVLRDKRVLVVSPFAESIERQYSERREKIFPGTEVLPQFELKTVKAYNTIGGNNPYKDITSWFDALEKMKEQMDRIDYDIALLGCGAYAFDLAAHAKRRGKKAITLCGSLQVLFGIYGVRYENYLKQLGLLNKYWIRPSPEERPEGYRLIENGAYW